MAINAKTNIRTKGDGRYEIVLPVTFPRTSEVTLQITPDPGAAVPPYSVNRSGSSAARA